MAYVKSFIKWAGGKEKELPIILSNLPQKFERYIEPFVGGGSVYLNINCDKSIINDKSDELILLYNMIKNNNQKFIKKLKEINMINDENYAKAYISDRIFLSTDGPNKIKQELFNYGIDEKIIEENINKIDKETIYNKCKKIIDKKIKSNTKYSNYMLNQKIISDLVNKGYDMALIKQILENEVFDNNLVIEKEFKKIYNKLSKKFDGSELYYNLKNKLYQKGFTKEEIEEYIKTVDF